MNPATAHPSTPLWTQWFAAAKDPAIDASLRDLFAQLETDIAARKPTCWLSGKCCKFDSYGHKLYVTGLEIAWLIHQLPEESRTRLREASLPDLDGCPFQVNSLCSVHTLRPLGCRVYFCDPTAKDWQGEVYEHYLDRLRRLHESHSLEYRYMEWREGLAEARDVLLSFPTA